MDSDKEWETEEDDASVSLDKDDEVGGMSVKSKEEIEREGVKLFGCDGSEVADTKGCEIPYLGVVYAPPDGTSAKTMIEDETTCVSDFAVLKLNNRVFRALPVAREEESGNIDFYEVDTSVEEKKIITDCKNSGIKLAWSKWVSKKSVSNGPDQTVFGDEKGCIYLSSDLLKQKRPAPKKKPAPPKKPAPLQKKRSLDTQPPAPSKKRLAEEAPKPLIPDPKRSRPMTLTITFDDYDALKLFAEKL